MLYENYDMRENNITISLVPTVSLDIFRKERTESKNKPELFAVGT